MPPFKRQITLDIAARLKSAKLPFMQVVLGPRQVGKTTGIWQAVQSLKMPYHFASADLPAPPDSVWIQTQWETARALARKDKPFILILDEVQKIERWSEVVKQCWDEDRRTGSDIRPVVLGSSSLLLQKGLTESLAGRFEVSRFLHWTFKECRKCFGWDIDHYLYFGGYPGAATLAGDDLRWAEYVRDSLIETAISKDILMLNAVDKPVLLRKLFVLGCEFPAQILSYQKVLGQLTDAGNTTTLANYQRLLQAAFLMAGLEKYSGSKIRQRSSSPKWLPLNTALVGALSFKSFEEAKKDGVFWGRLVECSIGAHLFNESARAGAELFYWREGNEEVDYVIKRGRQIAAIEVKTGSQMRKQSGLACFAKKFEPARLYVAGTGGIPVEKFLQLSMADFF